MSKEVRHVGMRMPVDLIDKIDKLADAHHRDRSGEIIHACAMYVEAHQLEEVQDTLITLISQIVRDELTKYDIRQREKE